MNRRVSEIDDAFLVNFRTGIWLLGIASWIFNITDKTIAAFADSHISVIELIQLFTACFFFIGWLYLKPDRPTRVTKAS